MDHKRLEIEEAVRIALGSHCLQGSLDQNADTVIKKYRCSSTSAVKDETEAEKGRRH